MRWTPSLTAAWPIIDRYKASVGGDRPAVSAGCERAALGCDLGGVPVVGVGARRHLRRLLRHPGGVGHGGERAGDGVRQYGRHLGNRRRLRATLTGAHELYGEFLVNAQGEEVAGTQGRRRTSRAAVADQSVRPRSRS